MFNILPETVKATLATIGQVAVELPCHIEGCREFVSVSKFETARIWGFQSQYPNLADQDIAYHLMRFRVNAQLIADDYNFCHEDLVGLQSIHVASEVDVLNILRIWDVSPESLRRPSETEVPI